MEFKTFIVKNGKKKYTFYQKLCQTKFVGLTEVNNFSLLRYFIYYILLIEN